MDIDIRILKTHQYGIVNPLQADLSILGDKQTGVSIAPHALKHSEKSLPRLISLAKLSSATKCDLLQCLAEQFRAGEPLLFCALLSSSANQTQIAHHLRSQLVLRDPAKKRSLFRLYDPRVLAHLRWILEVEQMQKLLGPIQAWTYALAGRWHTLRAEPVSSEKHFPVRPDQHAKIQNIGLINRLQAQQGASSGGNLPAPGAEIHALLSRANSAGLTEPDDLIAFAVHAITQHAEFYQHPRIRALLTQARKGGCGYHAASKTLKEKDWEKIRTDLNNPLEASHGSR